MVNSSSYDDLSRQQQTQDRNAKAEFKQPYNNVSSENKHSLSSCNKGFSETADTNLPSDAFAIEPVPTKTEFNGDMSNENLNIQENPDLQVSAISEDLNTSICCSVPLDKVQGVLTRFHLPKPDDDPPKCKTTRKLLCLYCDRSFVSANLRQKHVERVHSVKQNRRVSSRRQNQQLTVSPCVYCDKLNSTEKTLKDLFHHLINEHSNKYFGCLPCEQRFLTASHLADHNTLKHELSIPETTHNLQTSSTSTSKTTSKSPPLENLIKKEESKSEEIPVKVTRSKTKPKSEEPTISEAEHVKKLVTKKKSVKLKELMNKKLSVKSSRITIKRRESKRIQAIAKVNETPKRKRSKPSEKKPTTIKPKPEQSDSTNTTEKSTKSVPTCINPYPEFDCFYRVKKITDHSIDNLKISSLTFDDVFDKAFFNRIKCNIEENLLHHIDGKLFKNEESESRISNFEKISNLPQETQNSSSENYGCEISLNAVTPVASLSLNSQFGEDFESQIEYGSKPSKKKSQTKTDEVFHYKYFTRRKFQASILQHKENRDLSKLDMWTQLIIKKRQQKMLDDQKSAKEIQEYTAGDEYKSRIRREELNRILDRRGPFEDLKEEASKKVALDKLNSDSEDGVSHESFSEVREFLNEILNRVFTETECVENAVEEVVEKSVNVRIDVREIPSYLNLRRSASFSNDEIDRSDKITLICSSQETENFELPTNQVRGKNEIVELSGEWARCRMYICAACGAKLPNMKYLMEHKSLYHQNVWVQHYEFVGNQSELYRHLSIPALGKIGAVEESVPCKVWKRSDARTCTKCGKQCNSLGELHRHILECGGDWTWMLARKKCKYRPYGAKSRRKRRGLIHRVHIKRKTEPTEKKKYKKSFEGPRQRPSDADSIQRMLANLPAKRSTRKLISLQDGIYRARKKTQINNPINKKNKVKCGKVIYKSQNIKETTEKTLNTTRVNLTNTTQKNGNSTNRRTLRSLNKVLASRIIDSNPKLTVKRKLRVINEKRRTRKCEQIQQNQNEDICGVKNATESSNSSPKIKNSQKLNKDNESLEKRNSLRSQGNSLKKLSMKQLLTGKINIKSFFPIKKRKNKVTEVGSEPEISSTEDVLTKNKSNSQEKADVPNLEDSNATVEKIKTNVRKEPKKIKKDTFSKLVKSFSIRRKNINKLGEQKGSRKSSEDLVSKNESTINKEKLKDTKCINEDNTNKKRKLKQNFRNVISRVKKLKIDSETPTSSTIIPRETMKIQNENPSKDAFLDKGKLNDKLDPCAPPETIVIPSILEARENSADISETAPIVMKFNETEDHPEIPERIFRFESNNEKSLQAKGELNFDSQPVTTSTDTNNSPAHSVDTNLSIDSRVLEMQPISIETSVKPKVVPLVSPNMKGKIRKPTRGLNDCIAMLTNKLQKKTELIDSEHKTINKAESCLNLSHPTNNFRPFNEVSVPKLDCILKIPSFKTHYNGMEETALDLSMKSQSNPELNRKPEQESFWQTRKPNFLLPIDYGKSIWMPPAPLLKPSSIDQTIEEVIQKGYRNQKVQPSNLKSQLQWNSVDNIIQSVIDGYKEVPIVTKDKKDLKIKNSVDDIIEFVIADNRIDEEKDKSDIAKQDEVFTESNDDIKEDKISSPTPQLPVMEINNSESDKNGNNVKTKKKRGRRRNIGKTKNGISLKIEEKMLPTEEGISTTLGDILINEKPVSEKDMTKVDNKNITEIDNKDITEVDNKDITEIDNKDVTQVDNKDITEIDSKDITEVDNKDITEVDNKDITQVDNKDITQVDNKDIIEVDNKKRLVKCNGNPNVSDLLENDEKIQKSSSLDTAFVDFSDNKIMGNNIKGKKSRKIGQIRKNVLKKKGTKGKVLETDVDNLLNFEEICKSNISVTNLGTVSATVIQQPEIKLTTEDEPHLLENKVLLTQNLVLPSDSEDEIPLSILKQSENLDRIEEEENTSSGLEEKVDDKNSSECNNINENIDQTINQEIQLLKSAVKETYVNENANVGMGTDEDSEQLDKSHQRGEIVLDTETCYSEKKVESVLVNLEFKDMKELHEDNIIKKSTRDTRTIRNGNRSEDQQEVSQIKSIETETSVKQALNIEQEGTKEVSLLEFADKDSSPENSTSLVKEPLSKTSTNSCTVVFKTPKKVKRFSRKPGLKKRSVGRKVKLEEPNNSTSFDLFTAENSEPDTDDESLLSLQMSIKLKRNKFLSETNKNLEDAEESKVITCTGIDIDVENTILVNCNEEKDSVTSNTYTQALSFSDQNKSDDEISDKPHSYSDGLDNSEFSIQVEKHKEDKPFEMSSQNDTSLIFDKSDTNNFFDSGISDESLENLEREKIVSFPKKRGKKTKINRVNSKSSQISVKSARGDISKDDSISDDHNSFITSDSSIQKDHFTESKSELITNRSSRSRQRNSEMDLSDASNSTSDISSDKISEVQYIHEGESISPPSPKSICQKQTTDVIKDTTNLKEMEITKVEDVEIAVISDVAIDTDQIVPSCDTLLIPNEDVTKTKIQNSKTKFLKRKSKNSKSKVKKTDLSKSFEDLIGNTSEIDNFKMITSIHTAVALKNSEEVNPLELPKPESDVEKDIGKSFIKLKDTTPKLDNQIVESIQSAKGPKSNKDLLKKSVIRRSKSLKLSKKSSNNSLSKRSSSVSSTKLSQTKMTPEDSDKGIDETTNSGTVRKSRTPLRRSNNSTTQEIVFPTISDETTESTVDEDLPGRRPRSARTKVVSYAENDYNEVTDSSTPQEISPDSSPEKVTCELDNAKTLPKLTDIKLNFVDEVIPSVEEKDTLKEEAQIIFTKHKLRKRTKRKEKILRKIRNNKKTKKKYTTKKSAEVTENKTLTEKCAELLNEKAVECSVKDSNVHTEILLNRNISDCDSLEKILETNQNLTTQNKPPNVVIDVPDIIKEPPIKIIINKQKTRRKSKSFKKNNTKSQNDLFKDFALVIKKPKRLAPIITFTPTDSILKETYPNLVTTIVEPIVDCVKSADNQKISDENLDESVEEMDMELDEIPINTNIIERNSVQIVDDIKSLNEISDLNNDVKTDIKKVKSRKVKKKRARFTKKKSKIPVTTERLNLQDITHTLKDEPKQPEISLDSLSENNSFGDIVEINILDQNKFPTDIGVDCIRPVNVDEEEEFSNNIFTEAENQLNNEKPNIAKVNGLFTLSNSDVEPEKPVLKITRKVTKRKLKGKSLRKKIVINFKNKTIVDNNLKFSGLDVNKTELLNKISVNNNLLSPKEIECKHGNFNGILPIQIDENDRFIDNLETDKSSCHVVPVENSLKSERQLRAKICNEIPLKLLENNEVSSDKFEISIPINESMEKIHEMKLLLESTSTPTKINSFNLVQSSNPVENDLETIYTFNENEDFQIEKPTELSNRLPKRKSTSLPETIYTFSESVDFEIENPTESSKRLPQRKVALRFDSDGGIQKNNQCESLTETDDIPEMSLSQRRISRTEYTKLSENLDLLEKDNLSEISKDIDFTESKIPDSSNTRENSCLLKSLEIFEFSKTEELKDDVCSTEMVKGILLESELKAKDSKKGDTLVMEFNEEENVTDKQTKLEDVTKQDSTEEIEGNARRKSMRTAKVKALEHIHDEALAELTESQRNRELHKSKMSSQDEKDVSTNGKKNYSRKTKKNQKVPKILQNLDFDNKVLVEDKPPSFADLVADLAGLEELENSIERELNAGEDHFVNEEQNDLNFSEKLQTQEDTQKISHIPEQDNQELRRSRRGSRKIASYNENDLIDPLLDVVDRKKKNRRKDLLDYVPQDDVKPKKTKEEIKKLNCDELFDLLKTSNNEKSLSSAPQNSFTGTTYQENSVPDKDDLISKDIDLIDKENSRDPEKIYEFTESPENSEQVSFPQKGHKRKTSKSFANKNLSIEKSLSSDNADNSASSTSFQESILVDNSAEQLIKTGVKESNFCDICNKSFIRVENLIKHKRTLTHIQKLSELEAKQAKEKSKLDQITSEENSKLNSEEFPINFKSSLSDINIHNILLKSEKPNETMSQIVHSSFPNNDSLKLADIISDVLNKPSLASVNDEDSNFINSQIQTDTQSELRRYKSLGERKSFDADNISNSDHNSLPISEPYLSKTSILEKQISMLENIIENQTGVSYIDDISMSSNNSVVDTSEFSSKQDDSNNPLSKDKNETLNTIESSFLKPTQYEEISEDSVNVRNYEDQKLRKTLNRDEELFLECCSLLKSGSEVSSYSNQRSQKVVNRLGMKQFDEPESMEDKNLVQEPNYNLENDFSDGNSRIPTPLGDSYDDDASDSNTISSNWDINKMEPVFENNPNVSSNLNFQEVLNKAINQDQVEIISNFRKSSGYDKVDGGSKDDKKEELPDISTSKKKIITKGARKVFEGLKVSIPTEEINLEEVLNCSPKCKKVELQLLQSASDDQGASENMNSPQKPSRNARKSKPVKKAQVGSNLLFKVKKKKALLSPSNTTSTSQDKDNTKSIDVYDFEETQDNTDVFPKPDFRAFRCKKSNENITEFESDTESRDDYLEPFIAQPESITSSLSSSSSIRKSKAQESITKKKCMIMGRIFKNQAKSKIEDIDEEMRDIPIIDNEELVENFVANCKIIKNETKPKLSETEINQLFDQLLEKNEKDDEHSDNLAKTNSRLKTEHMKDKEKKLPDHRKKKLKNRKRARTNSESTDEEFNLNKSTKRIYRKNGKAEDNSINLEQELKECIGVASRKSQRKCTSGKQNVLVEYWSSDESQFEALLESQRIDNKSKQQPKISETKEHKTQESVPEEQIVSIIKSNTEFEKVPTILKPPPRPKLLKKSQSKRKHTGEKDKTINLNVTINSSKTADLAGVNRRKRAAANPLYHWSSSSEDESQDLIEIKPVREDEEEFEDDRPIQHGWIVGESPKKLVTMLAQAKGKKLIDVDCVKEQGKKRTNNSNS